MWLAKSNWDAFLGKFRIEKRWKKIIKTFKCTSNTCRIKRSICTWKSASGRRFPCCTDLPRFFHAMLRLVICSSLAKAHEAGPTMTSKSGHIWRLLSDPPIMRPLGLTDEVLSPHHDMILLRLLINVVCHGPPHGSKKMKKHRWVSVGVFFDARWRCTISSDKTMMKHGKTTNKKHQEAMKWRKLRVDPWTPHWDESLSFADSSLVKLLKSQGAKPVCLHNSHFHG